MANVIDYLKINTVKVSRKSPFNELDALALARVSYLPLTRIRMNEVRTLGNVAKRLERLEEKDFRWKDDKELIRLLGESERFREMKIADFVLDNDEAIEKQFSAVTIWVRPYLAYISYLGTDSSLYGWKEDFNMIFMPEVPAQTEAVKYFRSFCRHHLFSKVYLGGHSKGGNLAIYAAVLANDLRQMRIKKVYNFDGPGLRKKLADKDAGRPVIQKIESFIPQDSLIGRLLEHREKFTVVKSTAEPLLQHDVYSWEVEDQKFVRSTTTKKSDFNDRMITRWLESANEEERRIFVDGMFEVLKRSKAGNPMEVALNGVKHIPTLVRAYTKIDKERRKVMMEVAKKLLSAYYQTWRGR